MQRQYFIIALFYCLPFVNYSQEVTFSNIIATDFQAGNQILELKFPKDLPSQNFYIIWQNNQGDQGVLIEKTKKGERIFQLANNEKWRGRIAVLAISLPVTVKGSIREPDFSDHLKLFFKLNELNPGAINFHKGYNIAGLQFTWILISIFITSFFCLWFIIRKNWPFAFLISFLVSWGILDLRQMVDRWNLAAEISSSGGAPDPFMEISEFVQNTKKIVGDESWTMEPLSGVLNSYVKYHLAENKFVRSSRLKNLPKELKPKFLITSNPKNRRVLHTTGNFYLIQLK